MHEKGLDYICGVPDGATVCKLSIYCRRHLYGEREAVERSRPLGELILDESHDSATYWNKHRAAVSYHSCRLILSVYSKDWTAQSCNHSSCNATRKLDESRPSLSARPNTPVGVVRENTEKPHKLMKALFMSNLARKAATEIEDIVSYLHYKLACYRSVDLEVRAREVQVQSSILRPLLQSCKIT